MADLFSSNTAASEVQERFQPYPWKVGLEEYKALECDLVCDTKLVKLAEKLTERLQDGVKYGHVAAWLYGTWAKRVGRVEVELYWHQYDAWAAKQAALEALPDKQPADDADYDDDIPF